MAFLAIPILSFRDLNLVGSVQPQALLLNGVSALFSALVFAANDYVDWPLAARLSLAMALAAPAGAYAASFIAPSLIWIMFYLAVALAIWFLFRHRRAAANVSEQQIVVSSVPIAFSCGLLGVGPGFVIAPLLIRNGFAIKTASAITSVAVVPCSFAAFAMHVAGGADIDFVSATATCAFTAAGAMFGGFLASRVVGEKALKVLFALAIVGLCGYRTLISANWPAAGKASAVSAVAHLPGNIKPQFPQA